MNTANTNSAEIAESSDCGNAVLTLGDYQVTIRVSDGNHTIFGDAEGRVHPRMKSRRYSSEKAARTAAAKWLTQNA